MRGPVGRRRSLLLLGDRLTARPKHSDFRERISLRGEIKERRSSVEADTSRKALQAFRESVSMTEGARSFRRRGALALRFSPETGARQKRAAERSKRDGPSLGGFDPRYLVSPRRLGLEAIRVDQIPSLFWAASLQLLDVTAFPPKKRGKKAARRPREGPRRQCRRGRGSF